MAPFTRVMPAANGGANNPLSAASSVNLRTTAMRTLRALVELLTEAAQRQVCKSKILAQVAMKFLGAGGTPNAGGLRANVDNIR